MTVPGTIPATVRPPSGGLRDGWRLLVRSPDRVLVPALVLSVSGFCLHLVLQYLIGLGLGSRACTRSFLTESFTVPCGPSDTEAQTGLVLAILVIYTVGHLVVAGLYRTGLDTLDQRPVVGPFADVPWLRVALASAVLGALMTLATAFLLLPVLVLGFFSRYALLFVLERGTGPFAALGASARLVSSDLLGELGFVLRATVVLLLGFLLLGIGLYVAVPVVLLAQVHRFRVATDDPSGAEDLPGDR